MLPGLQKGHFLLSELPFLFFQLNGVLILDCF